MKWIITSGCNMVIDQGWERVAAVWNGILRGASLRKARREVTIYWMYFWHLSSNPTHNRESFEQHFQAQVSTKVIWLTFRPHVKTQQQQPHQTKISPQERESIFGTMQGQHQHQYQPPRPLVMRIFALHFDIEENRSDVYPQLNVLDHSIQILSTQDPAKGIRCQQAPSDPGEDYHCHTSVQHDRRVWDVLVQQLMTIRQVFGSSAFDGEALHQMLTFTIDLFVWVYCTCPLHRLANTHEDWDKLYRAVCWGRENGIRGGDMQDIVLLTTHWMASSEDVEEWERKRARLTWVYEQSHIHRREYGILPGIWEETCRSLRDPNVT